MIKRPLLAIAIALVLGESIAWWNPEAAWIMGMLFCAGSCLGAVSVRKKAGRITLEWFLPAFFLFGVFLWSRADRISEAEQMFMETQEMEGSVQGTVVSRQTEEDGSSQITLKPALIQTEEGEIFHGRGILIYLDTTQPLKLGNWIQAEGELSAFTEGTNPGQFDMKSYRKAQGVDGMMWGDSVRVMDGKTHWVRQVLWEFRETVKQKIRELTQPQDAGVFCAVFLGDKSGLDEEVKTLYEKSGIAHIYAVSGTHVSILGALFYQLIRRLTGSFGISAAAGSAFLLLYAILIGSPVSAVRAILMFICYMTANMKGRIYDLASALALSCIVILCWQPLQITQCGFQLSFGAVLGIGIVGPAILPRGRKHGAMAETIAMALGVSFMIMPIQLYHFFVYPIYSFFLNLCILPAAPFLVLSILGGTFLGFWSPVAGKFIFGTGHWILKYYQIMCESSLRLPFSIFTSGRPRVVQLGIYYLLLFGFVAVREWQWQRGKADVEWKREHVRKKWNPGEGKICLAGCICLGIGIFGLKRISAETWLGRMSVVMLDVGQGDGFVIRLPDGSVILVDGGSTSESQIGTYCLEPYLQYEGIDQIDYVLLSHGDADHVNGIQEILEHGEIAIKNCLIPDEKHAEEDFSSILLAAEEAGTVVGRLSAGMQIQKGEASLTCLHPEAGMETEDINDTSEVILLEMDAFRMLFTGDIGEEEEDFSEMLSGTPITVLKVAHHGSKYSTGETFLENVHAKYAWISCGKGNRYGHPHEETMERLKASQCEIYTTPEYGAVRLETDGERVYVTAMEGEDEE